MGCAWGCGGGVITTPTIPFQERVLTPEQIVLSEPCGYTIPLLTSWQTKLETILTEGKADLINLTSYRIRSYIGILMSAIRYPQNLCFYAPQLAPLVQIIQLIDDLT